MEAGVRGGGPGRREPGRLWSHGSRRRQLKLLSSEEKVTKTEGREPGPCGFCALGEAETQHTAWGPGAPAQGPGAARGPHPALQGERSWEHAPLSWCKHSLPVVTGRGCWTRTSSSSPRTGPALGFTAPSPQGGQGAGTAGRPEAAGAATGTGDSHRSRASRHPPAGMR